MMGSETDEIIEEPSESLLQRYQEALEESMKESDFILIVLMHCIMILIKYV